MLKAESTVTPAVKLEHLARPLDSEALDLALEPHRSAAPPLVEDFSVRKTRRLPSASLVQALALVTRLVLHYPAE